MGGKPFVLVQVEDNSVSETTIVGVQDMVSIIVDWDEIESDGTGMVAQEAIDEIVARYPNEINDDTVARVVDRLEEYVQDAREEDFGDDEDEEEDDEDSGILDDDEEDDEDEELAFDDEEELNLNENFKQVD